MGGLKMDKEKAKQWAGIIGVLLNNKYISLYTHITMAENIARQLKVPWQEMLKILNEAHNEIDFKASEAYVSVVWK